MKIFCKALLSLSLIFILASCSLLGSTKTLKFSYDDWAVCGLSPWPREEEIENLFGEAQWMSADGIDMWDTSAYYDFGNIGFSGSPRDGQKAFYINIYEPNGSMTLPRGFDIGAIEKDLLKSYRLGKQDEDGYFYGSKNTYPSAHCSEEMVSEVSHTGRQKLSFLALSDENSKGSKWLCELTYILEDGRVAEIRMRSQYA